MYNGEAVEELDSLTVIEKDSGHETLLKSEPEGEILLPVHSNDNNHHDANLPPQAEPKPPYIDPAAGNPVETDPSTIKECEDNLHGLSIFDRAQKSNIPNVEDILQQISDKQYVVGLDATVPDNIMPSFNQSCQFVDNHELLSQPPQARDILPHSFEFVPNREGNVMSSDTASSPIWVARRDIPQTFNDIQPIHRHTSDQQLALLPETTTQPPAPNEPVTEKESDTRESESAIDSIPQVPGPCEAEDLIEGIIFSANYLGTTQLPVNRSGVKNSRMLQAQEALNRIKVADGESQPSVLVDLFVSTLKIEILDANNQQMMMSHFLRSISYVADIGDILVVMAKPQHVESEEQDDELRSQKRGKVLCHVLCSEDSHLISQSVGQCFGIAYQQFLMKNSIEPQSLSASDFSQFLDTQDMYHDDLLHYSKEENTKEIWVEKKAGESMGIAIVESGWGSIIPTVILANLQHGSPIERSGKFSIGDQIMSINGTSLVGLPLQTCQGIIKGLRNQTKVKVNIVSCPPVVSVLIKRPDLNHQLGFSVQNGIICSLMRGGIAERGGVRVGHRIIEINHKSVVATPHEKIVQMLVTSVGEIQMKTMPSSMYRLLTGQEQPLFL